MRNSDYENVQNNFMKLYGNEEWMIEREIRWNKKTQQEKEIDRKLFYALVEPEKFQNNLYTADYEREEFQNLPKNLSEAKNLLENGATNDFIFKHQDRWGYCFCWTPLDISVARGFDEITELILQKFPKEIQKKDEYFHGPLYFGVLFQREKIWEKLEKFGIENEMISWVLGNVRDDDEKKENDKECENEIWNYLKKKYRPIENEIEKCFRNIRDRSLMTHWTYPGIKVLIKFIENDFGTDFVEKLLDLDGKNNPIFYPIRRQNNKIIFLGSILKQAGITGKVELEKYDFGIIVKSENLDQKFTILLNENGEFPEFVRNGKLAITMEKGRIYVSFKMFLKN